ncbi:ABC transporter permease [bacterium]|nr:ABC transporter permease [bacterium]
MAQQSLIQEQIRLPLKVAVEVVMQGIRIRFGRSLITIMGVVFGIAFLMSILTGQVLKKGVTQEDSQRTEVRRMYSFLTAEMGPPEQRVVSFVQAGPLSEMERRLVRQVSLGNPSQIRWAHATGAPLPDMVQRLQPEVVELSEVGRETSVIILVGEGGLPEADWVGLFAGARQRVLALSQKSFEITPPEGVSTVVLEREMRSEEAERLAVEARKARFRNLWIVIISLLVTIIGISNAMLMSVTERFREIGTMKCLGALSAFIRRLFLLESGFMGVVGGTVGCLFGAVFSVLIYGITYGPGLALISLRAGLLQFLLYLFLSLLAGVVLSTVAAIYPAAVASRMMPADALRTNV